MGASLDSGNLGVSALLASTVKCILQARPGARISLLEGARQPDTPQVVLADGHAVRLERVGVRRNKTVWRSNHLLRLLATACMIRMLPVGAWRRRLTRRNRCLRLISEAECIADITGGDSFSDIYGFARLLFGVLEKLLILAAGADLVLLPQTYGPFRARASRALARLVLSRAWAVYARDRESIETIERLIGGRGMRCVPGVVPDVAFVLDPRPPAAIRATPRLPGAGECDCLVGFNVSGLLYNGGYTRNNMFGLRSDYRSTVEAVGEALLRRDGTSLLLVPHVFTPSGHVESDPDACRWLYDALEPRFPGRVFLLEGEYDQSEIKHVIGRCGFFVGSRMHACIAAASQGIATAPMAYSRKFAGVFDLLDAKDCVVDLRDRSTDQAVRDVIEVFDRRASVAAGLDRRLPAVREALRAVFATTPAPERPSAVADLTVGVMS